MCCDKETFEEVKEGRVGLTRRQALKVMGVGGGLVALGGLTGCTSLLNLPEKGSNDSALLAQGSGSRKEVTALLRKSEDQWKAVFATLASAYKSHNNNLSGQLEVQVKDAKQLSLKYLDALDESGMSEEFNTELLNPNYDKEAASQLNKRFMKEFHVADLPPESIKVFKDASLITSRKKLWKEATASILKEGGLVQHVRKQMIPKIKAAEMMASVQQSSNNTVEAQGVACSVAAALCAGAAAASALICGLNPNSQDCRDALEFTIAVCAAACIACGCGGGGGGVKIIP